MRFDLLQWLLHSVMAPCMYALAGVGLYVCHTVCVIKCEWLPCINRVAADELMHLRMQQQYKLRPGALDQVSEGQSHAMSAVKGIQGSLPEGVRLLTTLGSILCSTDCHSKAANIRQQVSCICHNGQTAENTHCMRVLLRCRFCCQ